jgi:hypothetical protein
VTGYSSTSDDLRDPYYTDDKFDDDELTEVYAKYLSTGTKLSADLVTLEKHPVNTYLKTLKETHTEL